MLNLDQIDFGFKISTTNLEFVYSESGGAKIEVEAISLKNINKEDYISIGINFPIVAEIKCITINFYESNYGDFNILEKSNIADQEKFKNILSGFYEVKNSEYLQKIIKTYDPKSRFDLKHYIIAGYDSYIELIAARYTIEELS